MQVNNDNFCQYHDCGLPVNNPYNLDFCLGHSPIESKFTNELEFKLFILSKKINKKDYNFEGFIFPYEFDYFDKFPPITFKVNFNNCKFYGSKEKQINNKLLKSSLDLSNADFREDVTLFRSTFKNNIILLGTRFTNFCIDNCILEEGLILKSTFFAKGFNCEDVKLNSIVATKVSFIGNVYITNSTFQGEIQLKEDTLFSDLVSVKNCIFNKNVFLDNSTFKNEVKFESLEFKEFASFDNCIFEKDALFSEIKFQHASFDHSKFTAFTLYRNVVFNKVQFSYTLFTENVKYFACAFKNYCVWDSTIFNKNIEFANNEFGIFSVTDDKVEPIKFENVNFKSQTVFQFNNFISDVLFEKLKFDIGTTFNFEKAKFEQDGIVLFKDIHFENTSTKFEDINPLEYHQNPTVAFRYCNLKDVYFTKCGMTNFSFYTSDFDQVKIISSTWDFYEKNFFIIRYKRKNLIFEDKIYHESKKLDPSEASKLFENNYLNDLGNLSEIATMYRRFKTSLDSTKDYEQAGWFYFNEMEMKLKSYEGFVEKGEKGITLKKIKRSKPRMKYFIYLAYKIFAGYGEKPFGSFLWFVFFTILFTILNLFCGLTNNQNKVINYDFNFSLNGFVSLFHHSFWMDFLASGIYTLYRIIPISYFPISKESFSPIGLDGLLLSFLTTAILFIMLTFVGIGLKRIFRRF